MKTEIRPVVGREIEPFLQDIARLRIEVFREFPYLYDGDFEYEERYLTHYAEADLALFVLAIADGQVVGVSTAVAMVEADPEFKSAIAGSEFGVEETLYFGESVLDARFRGQGFGKQFFVEREAHAERMGLPVTCFCAVERPQDHPRKPNGYRPLHGFWRSLGYEHHPDIRVHYPWKDIDEDSESLKPMSFWFKR